METSTSLRIIRTVEDFASLEREWNALADASGCPLARHEWYMAALAAFHGDVPFCVVCLFDGDRLRAGCALVERHVGPFSYCEVAGMRRLGEWGALLAAGPEDLGDLLEALVALGRTIVLDRLPDSPELTDAVRRIVGRSCALTWRQTADAYRLPVTGGWADRAAAFPAARRKRLRRLHNRAAAMGKTALRTSAPDADSYRADFEAFARIEHSNRKGDAGLSLLANPDLHAFFDDLCGRFAAAGMLRFSFLDVGGTLAAGQLAIEHRGAVPFSMRPGIGEWIFGCDVCQEVCPWNRQGRPVPREDHLERRAELAFLDPGEILAMDEAAFRKRFSGTPLMRARWDGMRRNADIVRRNGRARAEAGD